MAIGTASAITGGLGLGLSAYQAISGNKQAKRAQNSLNSYERQELDNAFQDIPISTAGSDFLAEQNSAALATGVDAARNAGMRGIAGAIPQLVANNNNNNREAQVYLDDQINRRNYAIAGDNARIEAITENRDNMNINALSSQIQAGKQDMWSGIQGIANTGAYIANNAAPRVNANVTASNVSPQGYAPTSYNMAPTTSGPMNSYPTSGFNPNAYNYPAPADAPMYNPWNFNGGF